MQNKKRTQSFKGWNQKCIYDLHKDGHVEPTAEGRLTKNDKILIITQFIKQNTIYTPYTRRNTE